MLTRANIVNAFLTGDFVTHGLSDKRANAFSADNDVAARKAQAERLVPLKTVSGVLADLTGMWGDERAGRATTLARASGEAPFALRHPTLYGLGRTLQDAAIGGGIGAAGGAGIGMTLADLQGGPGTNATIIGGAGTGLAVGAGLGALTGSIRSFFERRKAIEDAQDRYAQQGGEPTVPEFNSIATLFPPRGQHRHGQMDAYDYLTGKSEEPRTSSALLNTLYGVSSFGTGVPGLQIIAPTAGLGTGVAQNVSAVLRAREALKRMQG